jgi:predicted 2-oxoglutarate/Fe(II)-dependent dioxygenase YbiX
LLHIVTDIDDSSCVGALAAHHDDVGALRKQYGFAQLGVFPGTPAQFQASPCSRFNIRWCLDPDRRLLGILHESYAAAARSGLLTCFLDPNLTWLDAVTGDHPYDHLQVLINRIAAPVPGYQTLTYHPPVIVTADVLDAALIRRLLDYQAAADDHSGDSQARYRRDVTVVDEALQTALDQAFARSLLPELRKVTGYDLRYREPYRIDCYTAGENGAFHKHRQTEPVAQSHRRYAVSLVLNETFKGAELIFPEYNHACGHYAYAPKAGSAVVFPAPLMHEINPVSVGQCFVLTTFLFDAEQAAYRSCYRQFHDEADDTAHLHTRVEQRFRDLPINSIDTRSLRQSVIDRIGFSRKTLTSSPEPRSEPRLMDTPPGIMVIENYFSAERCRRLREYADAKLGEKLQVVDFAQSSSTKTVSVMSEGRVTERVPLDDIKQQVNNEFTRIYGVILANFYHVEFEWFEEPQMLRYTPGGFYNRHADAEHWLPDEERWVRTLDRDYSALVYLNSDFDGGELYFPRLDFRFKPKQGMLASFPSNYRYEHAAEPITAGMRYALVSWAAILGTPRVKDNAPYGSVFLS